MSSEFSLIALCIALSFCLYFSAKYLLSKLSIVDKIKEYIKKLSQ